jgi:hypothetical protein
MVRPSHAVVLVSVLVRRWGACSFVRLVWLV